MATDRKLYFDILTDVRKYNGTLTFAKNAELIRVLPLEEARELVFSWLQSVEDSPPVDFEMVRRAPCVCRSIPRLDDDVMAWLKLRPTELRYEIGLKFIAGCWGGNHVASESCLEFVTHAVDSDLERQTDAYAYALTALYIVADPVDDINVTLEKRRELSEKLLTHLPSFEKQGLHPDIAKSLASLKDFETRKFYAIFDKSKDLDMSRLVGNKRAEIIDALLKWLEIWTKPGWFDQERMWYAGRFMAYALGDGIDQSICEWMQDKPSLDRYAVATAFLSGYWRMDNAVSQQCVDTLRSVIQQFPPASDAHKGAAMSLTIAAEKISQSQL